jgi:hypothetical protein
MIEKHRDVQTDVWICRWKNGCMDVKMEGRTEGLKDIKMDEKKDTVCQYIY